MSALYDALCDLPKAWDERNAAATYTPGPWRIGTSGPNGCPIIGTERGLMVAMLAHTTSIPEQRSQAEANANLIIAAPDMLDALIVAREFVSTDRNSLADTGMNPDGTMDADTAEAVADYDAALLQIDAAIAKATGSAS